MTEPGIPWATIIEKLRYGQMTVAEAAAAANTTVATVEAELETAAFLGKHGPEAAQMAEKFFEMRKFVDAKNAAQAARAVQTLSRGARAANSVAQAARPFGVVKRAREARLLLGLSGPAVVLLVVGIAAIGLIGAVYVNYGKPRSNPARRC
ncbi:hypothetical protein [Rhodococcus opacus]|uniref:hypothetical protein n=1 Tax=Rhodococcus opacus TaxID=37919 RepID=UPI0018E42313|nr:hypothetical protein [Rhodococcus opacus]